MFSFKIHTICFVLAFHRVLSHWQYITRIWIMHCWIYIVRGFHLRVTLKFNSNYILWNKIIFYNLWLCSIKTEMSIEFDLQYGCSKFIIYIALVNLYFTNQKYIRGNFCTLHMLTTPQLLPSSSHSLHFSTPSIIPIRKKIGSQSVLWCPISKGVS